MLLRSMRIVDMDVSRKRSERKRKECAPFNQPNQLLSPSVLPLDLFFVSITQVY